MAVYAGSKVSTPECHRKTWALPIIASVSLTHLPCLFACFYESVSCVYAVFSTYLSICIACAACFVFCSISLTAFLFSFFFFYKFNGHLCHGVYWCTYNPANMPKTFFYLHLHSSNSCVCVSKHVYAFPSSSILIHIYCHILKYDLCPVLYLSPSFCFSSSFPINLIDTYVTVPIDVSITPLICLDSFPSTSSSSFLTCLPPHVNLCLHPNIHTYFNTSSGPFIRTSCFLMCSLTCKFLRMCTSTCIRISLLLHVHTQLPPFSYVWLMFCCIIITIFLFSFLCF